MSADLKSDQQGRAAVWWTLLVVFVHGFLAYGLILVLWIAGPDFVGQYEPLNLDYPLVFHDVLWAVRLLLEHGILICVGIGIALVLDGAMYHWLVWRGDTALSRVWTAMIALFLVTLIVLTVVSMLMAKEELLSTRYIY